MLNSGKKLSMTHRKSKSKSDLTLKYFRKGTKFSFGKI